MESVTTKVKRTRHHDRVTLDQECLQRVDGWIEQVTQTAKGVTLSRKDMVNWIIRRQEESLPPDAAGELKARFFNEVRFLQQAIRELKSAKSRGEQVSLDTVLAGQAPSTLKRLRSARKRKIASPGGAVVSQLTSEESADNSERVNKPST